MNDLAVRNSKGFSGRSRLTLAAIFRPSPCARGQHPTAGQQPSVPQSATGLWFRLLAMAADRHNGRMDSYRIVPGHRVYRVEAVDANGNIRIVGTWPTEDAAISHLKTLQERSCSCRSIPPGAVRTRLAPLIPQNAHPDHLQVRAAAGTANHNKKIRTRPSLPTRRFQTFSDIGAAQSYSHGAGAQVWKSRSVTR